MDQNPFLAKRIAHLVKNGLVVPADAIAAVAGSELTPTVHPGDFAKNPKTIERRWAEVSYIKWWLDQHHREEDASFFAEKSFNWDGLVKDYDECGIAVTAARDEAIQNQKTKEILSKFADERLERLHVKFARLIACYLVYKHGSFNDLRIAAEHFGIDFSRPPAENPLSYSIIYVGTAVAAVYIGVYFSAIIYDLIQGKPLSEALSSQDHDLVVRWVAFTAANYGTPIVVILGIRYLLNKFNMDTARSYIARYFWVFFVAVVVGPFFLAVAVKAFGTPAARAIDFLTMYHRSLVWGIGPGLVCVYLYYYLDRQTQPDLPDIVQQRDLILLRLFVSFIFTCVVMLILLPPLMEIKVTYQSAWDNNKVRFVATSVAFLLTLSLAVVAQFGLRKPPTQAAPAAEPASPGRGVPIETVSMRLPWQASTLSAVERWKRTLDGKARVDQRWRLSTLPRDADRMAAKSAHGTLPHVGDGMSDRES